MTAARIALRGDLLDFVATPARADRDSPAVRWRPDHWLLIQDGRIVGAQAAAPDVTWQRIDHAGKLILPGFIDTHPRAQPTAGRDRLLGRAAARLAGDLHLPG